MYLGYTHRQIKLYAALPDQLSVIIALGLCGYNVCNTSKSSLKHVTGQLCNAAIGRGGHEARLGMIFSKSKPL